MSDGRDAREAGRAATRGDAFVEGLSAGMTWVARMLAEALAEAGKKLKPESAFCAAMIGTFDAAPEARAGLVKRVTRPR